MPRNLLLYFASSGIASAIVHRPRIKFQPEQDINQIEKYLRQAVVNIRQALDWLVTREEIDAEKTGSFGISFGGIINTIAAGVEPRLKYNVIALAGGSLADIICYSHEESIKVYREKIIFDNVVGRKYSRRLWKEIGRPEVTYLPFGHYSSILAKWYVKAQSLNFFKNKFELWSD